MHSISDQFTWGAIKSQQHICQHEQKQTTQLKYSIVKLTWYIHSGRMELLKVVVLVSAFVYASMALSIEGEQKGVVKISIKKLRR